MRDAPSIDKNAVEPWFGDNFLTAPIDNESSMVLLFDNQCPVCRQYWRMVRINESIGPLVLVDARIESMVKQQAIERALDLNKGLVLKVGRELYHGAEVMTMLALMSGRVGLVNRTNYWIFKSTKRTRLIYPALVYLRSILLLVLGKDKIK
jgi:predicted DCC family thiol-disulfide oxidoreductase YuxK